MTLHDIDNPEQEVVIDAADFSAAIPLTGGAGVRLKDSDQLIRVHENSIEVKRIYLNAL